MQTILKSIDYKNCLFKSRFFFLHVQFTLFKTKSLKSPGTYISKRTWGPTQKTISK